MFESKVFRKQTSCIEGSTCDIAWIFSAPLYETFEISLWVLTVCYRIRLRFGNWRKHSIYEDADKSQKRSERYSDGGVPGKHKTQMKTGKKNKKNLRTVVSLISWFHKI